MPEVVATVADVHRSRRVLLVAGYLTLALTIAWIVWQESSVLPMRIFGTPSVPHSDALGPWLHGAVTYAFLDQPLWYLYRPTIGIFFASILSLHFDTRAIPAVFIVAAIAFLASMFHRLPARITLALVLWLVITAIGYPKYFANTAPWTLTIDFPAFFFTFAGTLLGLRALEQRLPGQLIAAFGILGLAAALRGPMLLAGPVLAVAAINALRVHPRRLPILLFAAVAFVAPFVVDVVIQRAGNIVNNGILSLYCFYGDPTGSYTMDCQSVYQSLQPTTVQILRGYFTHLTSWYGLRQVGNNLYTCLAYATTALTTGLFPLAAIAAIATLAARIASGTASATARQLAVATAGLSGLAVILFGITRLDSSVGTALATVIIPGAVAVAAWHRRSSQSALLLAMFLAGAVFLALLGLVLERLIETFSFMLQLAFLIVALDMLGLADDETPPIATDRTVTMALLVLVGTLYAGHTVLDPPLKMTYLLEVRNQPAAIKIAADRRFDRSLYFLGNGHFVYTRHDGNAIGSVVRYSAMTGADGHATAFDNASLFRPAVFIP